MSHEVVAEAAIALVLILGILSICSYLAVYFGVGRRPIPPKHVDEGDPGTRQAWIYWTFFKRFLLSLFITFLSGLGILWYRIIDRLIWEMTLILAIGVLVWWSLDGTRWGGMIWLVCVIAWIGSFTASYLRWLPGSPQRAVHEFLTSVKSAECDKAWQYFSKDAQKAIEAEAHRLQAQNAGKGAYDYLYSAHNLYCLPNGNPYPRYDARKVVLLTKEADRARVGVREGESAGFLIPGFFPTRTIWHDREMELVREGREWKLSRP